MTLQSKPKKRQHQNIPITSPAMVTRHWGVGKSLRHRSLWPEALECRFEAVHKSSDADTGLARLKGDLDLDVVMQI